MLHNKEHLWDAYTAFMGNERTDELLATMRPVFDQWYLDQLEKWEEDIDTAIIELFMNNPEQEIVYSTPDHSFFLEIRDAEKHCRHNNIPEKVTPNYRVDYD